MNSRDIRSVIDVHQHMSSIAIGAAGTDRPADDGRADTQRADTQRDDSERADVEHHESMLDRLGITASAAMVGLQYERPNGIVDTRSVNSRIAAFRDRSPRVLAALGTVEPLHGLEVSRRELHRMVGELHLDGVVWHTRYQGVAVSDSRMHALIDEATALHLPCFVHMFAESTLEAPWMFAELARDHPEATIVALDGFSSATQVQYVMDLADRFENLLFDTAICFPLLRPLDTFVERFGSDRLLFGTDSYTSHKLFNHPSVMHELIASDMDDDHLENIFWKNFCRLFPNATERLELLAQRAVGGAG